MKKIIKQAIVAVILLASIPIAKGQNFSYTVPGGQTLCFKIINGSATVTSPYDTTISYNQLGNLVIPDSVEYNGITFTVNAIDSNAFALCGGLTSISIPSSITSIGERAFRNANNLARTDYRGSLTQWCMINFGSDNEGFKSKNITANPIFYSKNLYINGEAINTESFSESITEIKGYTFVGLTTLTGELTFPEGLFTIGTGAFYQCSGLTNVHLPSTLKRMESSVFRECVNVSEINLPEGIEHIGNLCFCLCSNLESITIPRSLKYIGENCFQQCSTLHSVVYLSDSCQAGIAKEGLIYPLFGSACTSLTSLTIGENVKIIPDYTFAFCRQLTEIVIPDSVTSIGKASFQTCERLGSITIGKNVQTIGDSAFGWCCQLWRIISRPSEPPTYGIRTFEDVNNNLVVYVTCNSISEYQNNAQWGMFEIDGKVMFDLSLSTNNDSMGTVEIIEQATCSNPLATIKAIAYPGYSFSQWSDGATDNPRQIALTQDTEITAFFVASNGIPEDNFSSTKVYSHGRDVIIKTKSCEPVSIFDISGRSISNFEVCNEYKYIMPYSGIFFVKVGHEKQFKVIVF